MPILKKREERLRLIDTCLRSGWYSQKELLDKIKRKGFAPITQKTLQTDMAMLADGNDECIASHYFPGREKKFRYRDESYSYFAQIINEGDISMLWECIVLLRKHKGLDLANELTKLTEKLSLRFLAVKPEESLYFQPEILENYSGDYYLPDLLGSCKLKSVLRVTYQAFYEQEPQDFLIHCHFMRQFNSRWYLVGTNEADGLVYTLPLDRIQHIKNEHKIKHNDRNLAELTNRFKNVIGITLYDKPVESVRFKVKKPRDGYLRTKPIHESQQEIVKSDNNTIYQIDVIINKELEAALLSYGCDLEVLEPESLRKQTIKNLKESLKNYT